MQYLVHYTCDRGFDWGWADTISLLKSMIKDIRDRETNVVFHGIYLIEKSTSLLWNSDGELTYDHQFEEYR